MATAVRELSPIIGLEPKVVPVRDTQPQTGTLEWYRRYLSFRSELGRNINPVLASQENNIAGQLMILIAEKPALSPKQLDEAYQFLENRRPDDTWPLSAHQLETWLSKNEQLLQAITKRYGKDTENKRWPKWVHLGLEVAYDRVAVIEDSFSDRRDEVFKKFYKLAGLSSKGTLSELFLQLTNDSTRTKIQAELTSLLDKYWTKKSEERSSLCKSIDAGNFKSVLLDHPDVLEKALYLSLFLYTFAIDQSTRITEKSSSMVVNKISKEGIEYENKFYTFNTKIQENSLEHLGLSAEKFLLACEKAQTFAQFAQLEGSLRPHSN